MMKKIAIGTDHAGYSLKESIVQWLKDNKYKVVDFGTESAEPVDYPDIAHILSSEVEEDEQIIGILLCGSGNGMAMAANKHPGIRAALCWNAEIAALAKKHNDANIICLPARFINFEMAVEIINAYLEAEFEGGRHLGRINKIPC